MRHRWPLQLAAFAALAVSAPCQLQFDNLDKRHIPASDDVNHAVALGDVDGDGDRDLITGNRGSISGPALNRLYLNDGTGHYTDVTTLQMPGINDSALAVALGDVDGDGDPDVVFGNTGNNRLLLNDGRGFFTDVTAGRLPIDPAATHALVLADVDRDGDNDLILGNNSKQNRLYLNDGRGFFTDGTAGRMPVEIEQTMALAWADVDGDGDGDLVLANGDGSTRQNRLYLNDGGGNFADVTSSQMPTQTGWTHAVTLGDVDGDGDVDIVFGNANTQQNRLLLNDGSGVFTDATLAQLPIDSDFTEAVTLADADADGDLDLLLGNAGQDRYYENDGLGTLADVTSSRMPAGTGWTRDLAMGDVDGDSDPDLVSAGRLYLNIGPGTLVDTSVPRLSEGSVDSRGIAIGDVDGDGDPDLVFAHILSLGLGYPNSLHLNDGRGFFEVSGSGLPAVFDGSYDVALGDLDGDQDLDLVVANGDSGYTVHASRILLNDGTGTFADTGQLPHNFDNSQAVALGDVDGDLDVDIVLGNGGYGEQNRLYLNDGTGSFSNATGQRVPVVFDHTNDAVLGDIDGDGDLDIVFGNSGFYGGERNRLHRNDGHGFFTDVTANQMPVNLDRTHAVELLDVDADRDLDLVVANSSAPSRLLLNNGTGFFTEDPAFAAMQIFARAVAAGDVDEDGDPDLVFANVGLYLNDGTGAFTDARNRTAMAPFAESVALADLDGDGDSDLTYGLLSDSDQIHVNLLRQLDSPFVPGSVYQLDAYARYGPARNQDVVLTLISSGAASVSLPPFGTLGVDLSAAVALPPLVIPREAGVSTVSFAIPNTPSVSGITLYAQALLWQQPVSARLTNVTFDQVIR